MHYLKWFGALGIGFGVCGILTIGFVCGVASRQYFDPSVRYYWAVLHDHASVDTQHAPIFDYKDPWGDVEAFDNEISEELLNLVIGVGSLLAGAAILKYCRNLSK